MCHLNKTRFVFCIENLFVLWITALSITNKCFLLGVIYKLFTHIIWKFLFTQYLLMKFPKWQLTIFEQLLATERFALIDNNRGRPKIKELTNVYKSIIFKVKSGVWRKALQNACVLKCLRHLWNPVGWVISFVSIILS